MAGSQCWAVMDSVREVGKGLGIDLGVWRAIVSRHSDGLRCFDVIENGWGVTALPAVPS